jgi:CIC family chloride channel protein
LLSQPPHMPHHLGDYSLKPRVLIIMSLAVIVGAIGAMLAIILHGMIGLFTNLVFYQRISFDLVAPGAIPHSKWLILLAPIGGGLLVGLLARYGSEGIRGHGMPEAIDAILRKGSKIQPRVAFLKPLSAAITIGTGGPFGAEGPIIMTGGAFGSVLAQFLKLTADERKVLLVAGAASGMAAIFNAPLAAVFLAIELLLFEWRPRSYLPVVVAVVVATLIRGQLMGSAPIFPVPDPHVILNPQLAGYCVLAGLAGGLLAIVATQLVYFSEFMFEKLPIHWMWWPAIGGLIIGLGGLVEPRALGVGYDVLASLLQGQAGLSLVVGILVVKTLIWSLSLGSGTSGGVFAPVFMIGAALGAVESLYFPTVAPGFWALIGLAAMMGGMMRSPLTGVIFALELTHQWSAMLALTIASSSAYGVSALLLKRSVLTEKVARNGFHLSREYSVDPLDVLFVREVMHTRIIQLQGHLSLATAAARLIAKERKNRHHYYNQGLYPVVDQDGQLSGILTRRDLLDVALEAASAQSIQISQKMTVPAIIAYPDETLKEVAQRMAEHHISHLPVVQREQPTQLIGLITQADLLRGHLWDLQEERDVERVLRIRQFIPFIQRRRKKTPPN